MNLKYFIPDSVKLLILRCVYNYNLGFLWDLVEKLLGRTDASIPPLRIRLRVGPYWNARHYKAVGHEYFTYFKKLCGLKPYHHVLDVGCGDGQMAILLAKYLDKRGSYYGFDIDPIVIKWCKEHITPVYPNFRFEHADLVSKRYNPRGRYKSREYVFPHPDESFDFVFLKSVFTHMLPPDMEHYFSEIVRVLKKGGVCFITYHLLNEDSLQYYQNKLGMMSDFKFDFGYYRLVNPDIPESAVAYEENYIRRLYKHSFRSDKHSFSLNKKFGLTIREPIHYGSWCGRKSKMDVQDFVIAVKK